MIARFPIRSAAVATAAALVASWPLAASATPQSGVELPTPLEHYEEFEVEATARALLPLIALQLDAATLEMVMARFNERADGDSVAVTGAEALQILDQVELEPYRPQLIELLIHGSGVLDLIPVGFEAWEPLVHDSFLAVLDGMGIARIRDRIAGQASLPPDADRGTRLLAFGAETPSFQKMGQIIGRSPWVAEDLRAALQTLESDIVTTTPDELRALVEEGLGPERLDAYQLELEDEVLSEASVGAVIGATLVLPGEAQRRRVVVKVIKSYAVEAINEDLDSISMLLDALEENRDFYGIGATPLVDMFREVRSALAQEIEASDERAHLRRAGAYFADDPRTKIPWLCDCSAANVTVMERIEGYKVTDAYPGDPAKRAALAERLADVMLYQVLFSAGDSLFHGDPHAGNVFFIGDTDDPNRIALLDWGLQGDLSYEQKRKLVQISLGLELAHADRLRKNMDALVDAPIDADADRARLDAIIEAVFDAADAARGTPGTASGGLAMLDTLVSEMATAGYTVDGDVLLFVKSVFTISSVITDLDPDFVADEYVWGRVTGQVMKEMPKRIGNTVWIPGMWSHEYASMASNNDVWASALNSVGLGFKAVGVGIWRGISFPFR